MVSVRVKVPFTREIDMYRRQRTGWLKHLDFMLLDIIMLWAAYILAAKLRFGFDQRFLEINVSNVSYFKLGIVMTLVAVIVAFSTECYSGILRRKFMSEFSSSIKHCTMVFAGLLIYLTATKQSDAYSRIVIFIFWGISAVFVWIERIVYKSVLRRRVRKKHKKSSMLLVTTLASAKHLVESFMKDPYHDFSIDGIVIIDKNIIGSEIEGIPVVASADSFYEYVRVNVVDEVFVNSGTISDEEYFSQELMDMGITVHYKILELSRYANDRMLDRYGDFVVVTSSMRIASGFSLFIKRTMDVAGSLVGLLFCGIAFLIFAIPIKLQAPGPVFFSQIRIGKNGRPFKFYKFRSMYVDAEERKKELMAENEMDGLMFKMKDDPRIYPLGKFLRKTSIDELPQFWNVLKGDMSLVGTRPPTVDEFELYEAHHKARLSVKPGITGMWQATGRSDITNFEEVVKLDTRYITEWSIGLDIYLLLLTIKVVLTGRGAE